MGWALVILAAYTPFGLSLWLRHQRRMMVHRERLAAIEKGILPAPMEQEERRRGWNVQRMLLLVGLIWLSLGIAASATLGAVLTYSKAGHHIPSGLQFIGLAPAGIGISFLVVYFVGKKREE